LTVSIGIAPNRFLAKTAAGLNKPDGLDVIHKNNFLDVYKRMELTDISGIKTRNAARLTSHGVHSVVDFYNADRKRLEAAFQSINGYYWYLRLHGWEIDDVEYPRRSFGNSVALGEPLSEPHELSPILQKLVEKMGFRMRKAGYKTKGLHVAILYQGGTFWHHQVTIPDVLIDSRDIYKVAYKIFMMSPYKGAVRDLAVSSFNLIKADNMQLELFSDVGKKEKLAKAVDSINNKWGDYTVSPAMVLVAGDNVKDRIAFGGIKDLEEFTLSE